MEGRYIALVPLDAAAHAGELWEGTRGAENDWLWDYLFDGPYADRAAFDAAIGTEGGDGRPTVLRNHRPAVAAGPGVRVF